MVISLENITAYLALATAIIGIVKYVIIDPLKQSIDELKSSIISYGREQKEMREEVIVLKGASKAAFSRIDDMREEIKELKAH